MTPAEFELFLRYSGVCIVVILIAVVLIPSIVFLCVKYGTMGYHSAKDSLIRKHFNKKELKPNGNET